MAIRAFLMAAGWFMLIVTIVLSLASPSTTPDERLLPSLAVTPLRSLVPGPGAVESPSFHDGALVRVEGYLRSDPPIVSRASRDHLYALQHLLVTHEYSRWEGETWFPPDEITDVDEGYDTRLWLDTSPSEVDKKCVEVRIPVDCKSFRIGNFPLRGQVDTPGVIPAHVARAIGPVEFEPKVGQKWMLWAIPQHARVTVLAPVRLRDGRAVLELSRDRWCAVWPDDWEDIIVPPTPAWVMAGLCTFFALLALLPVPWDFWRLVRDTWRSHWRGPRHQGSP